MKQLDPRRLRPVPLRHRIMVGAQRIARSSREQGRLIVLSFPWRPLIFRLDPAPVAHSSEQSVRIFRSERPEAFADWRRERVGTQRRSIYGDA
ncbi:hypothetical protein [Sorangium cellulosum]|uniref:hypothetical protein n=1 Tax=Sorangium cellulosum TaxID=56 RepID=UPI0012FF9FC9|nr:hypothetical protein [Sorangium cellulosum]